MASNESMNLQKFIISVVIVGVVLVMGIYITSSIAGVTKAPDTVGYVVNESVTFGTTDVPRTLSVSKLLDVSCTAVTAISNATGVSTGTVNVTLSGCTVLNASTLALYGATRAALVSYTYTYTATTDASNSAEEVVTALATGTSWISILVVVGFATIILTMLTSGLGNAASRGETPYY
jgi:hypothetical protein